MRRKPAGSRERTSGDGRRDGTFLPIVTCAGVAGAALGWWHGWSTVGALAPLAGAAWFAGIIAIALGQSEAIERDATTTRRQWRP